MLRLMLSVRGASPGAAYSYKTYLQNPSVLCGLHFLEYAKNGSSIHPQLTNENSGFLHQVFRQCFSLDALAK